MLSVSAVDTTGLFRSWSAYRAIAEPAGHRATRLRRLEHMKGDQMYNRDSRGLPGYVSC
jgi:hypothetical protein